ncbi:hypothetical protein D3C80_1917300 [compost metagenome]
MLYVEQEKVPGDRNPAWPGVPVAGALSRHRPVGRRLENRPGLAVPGDRRLDGVCAHAVVHLHFGLYLFHLQNPRQ